MCVPEVQPPQRWSTDTVTGVAVHPTVTVAGPFGDVEFDVMLAPVIAALWTLGVRTRQCCQYNELADSAEISFPTASDMTAFVAALFPAGDDQTDELQSRIRDRDVHDPAPSPLRAGWRWVIAPEWTEGGWDFAGLVQFPPLDIPVITDRLRGSLGA